MLKRIPAILSPELLDAILPFFPLDTYIEQPVAFMQVLPQEPIPPIRDTYRKILEREAVLEGRIAKLERFRFYEEAKKAYAIVATGESAVYANILLQKGVI